jgi:hypothetical protein
MEESAIRSIENLATKILGFELNIEQDEEISSIVSMTQDDINTLTRSQCNTFGFKLIQYALNLQLRVNKTRALRDLLDSHIKKAIAREIHNYKGMSWEYAEINVVNNDAAIEKIYDRVKELDRYITLAYNLIVIIKDMAKKIEGIAYDKTAS